MRNNELVAMRLPEPLIASLRKRAAKEPCSNSHIMRRALRAYLKRPAKVGIGERRCGAKRKLVSVRLPQAMVRLLDNRVSQECGVAADGIWRDCDRSVIMRRALAEYLG